MSLILLNVSSYVVSFSATPNLHMVNQPTLREKVQFTSTMDWGMNTNMQVRVLDQVAWDIFVIPSLFRLFST